MARYEDLCFFDVLEPIQPFLNQKLCWINKDGLVESKLTISHICPWLFGKFPAGNNCDFLTRFVFGCYRIIPRECMNCWKIVTHPKNLDQAFAMLKLQKKLEIPSKTGMEQREYSGHLGGWSSFWYCPRDGGLEGARETFAKVEEQVKREFGDEAPKVDIKRGCTEMEKAAGPSDKWMYPLEAELREQMIEAVFVPRISHPHPRMLEVRIEKLWIEWAAAHGDLSYLKHCEKPIINPQVHYNETIHSDKDFCTIERRENDRNAGPNNRGCSCGSEDCSCSGGNEGGNGNKPAQGIVLV